MMKFQQNTFKCTQTKNSKNKLKYKNSQKMKN